MAATILRQVLKSSFQTRTRWMPLANSPHVVFYSSPAMSGQSAAAPNNENLEARDDEVESIVAKVFEESASRMSSPEACPLSEDELDWNTGMKVVKTAEKVFPPKRPTEKELLSVRASRPTATLASLVNESVTLRNLVDLGVNLSVWEKNGHLGLAVKLDFVADVAPLVRFLADIGIPHSQIGSVLTRCPELLEQEGSHLTTRVSYLLSKRFTREDVVEIVRKNPNWLCFSVKGIDSRLGFLQKCFQLTGSEVRHVVRDNPGLVLWDSAPDTIKIQIFCISEEMGFSKAEMKEILLGDSRVFQQKNKTDMFLVFDLLHNVASIPHSHLVRFPSSLRADYLTTKQRFEFLKHLGRLQFDPSLPHYTTPEMLTETTDEEFCEEVALCDVQFFYSFLKTI